MQLPDCAFYLFGMGDRRDRSISDASHALVQTILRTLPKVEKRNHIAGSTDYGEHPVFQTKQLKFGLRRLQLDDPYEIPEVFD